MGLDDAIGVAAVAKGDMLLLILGVAQLGAIAGSSPRSGGLKDYLTGIMFGRKK